VTDDAPKIASTLERTRLFMAALNLVQALLHWSLGHYAIGAALFLGGLLITLRAARILSTQVSSADVSQLTWRGRIRVPWDDVTTVTRRKRSIVLTSLDGSVVVEPEGFCDTQGAVEYLDRHLPYRLRLT
jgi:hypothetical protein